MNWRIFLLALGTFALGTDAFVIAGILPQLAAGLDVGIEAAGQVVSAYSLTYAFGAPLIAAAASRWRRGQVVIAGLAMFTVANLLSALAPTYPTMIVVRVLAGISAALFTPAAYALAADLAPAGRRGAALAMVSLGLAVSTVIGVPAGSWIGLNLGWRMSFVLITILSAAGLVGLWAGHIAKAGSQMPQAVLSLKQQFAPMAHAPVLLALLPMLMWSTAYFAVYIYLAPMLAGWTSSDHLAGLLLVFGLGCLAGNRMGGWLADRYGPFRPILVCAAGGALSQALLAMSPHSAFALASLLVAWGVCSWANFAPQQSRLLSIEPEHGPLVLSLNNSMNYLGSALGAAVGALTISATSVTYLPFAGGALYLAAVLALLVSRRWR